MVVVPPPQNQLPPVVTEDVSTVWFSEPATSTPDQLLFHSFHTVPKFNSRTDSPAASVNVSNTLGISTVISGSVSVSIQSSWSGVKVSCPTNDITSYGFRLTVVLAYCCSISTVSVYGKVIRSPVFW